MSFRDDDDDTSAGRMTQGGSRPRRGKTILWVLPVAVIVLAIVIAVLTLPKKHSKAEEGTAPVSTPMNATGPAGAVAAPSAPPAVSGSPSR